MNLPEALAELALEHPSFVQWIEGVVLAALGKPDPFRAALRHAARTLAEHVGEESASTLLAETTAVQGA